MGKWRLSLPVSRRFITHATPLYSLQKKEKGQNNNATISDKQVQGTPPVTS